MSHTPSIFTLDSRCVPHPIRASSELPPSRPDCPHSDDDFEGGCDVASSPLAGELTTYHHLSRSQDVQVFTSPFTSRFLEYTLGAVTLISKPYLPGGKATAMWCSRCRDVWHCSPYHLRPGWPRHRGGCVAIPTPAHTALSIEKCETVATSAFSSSDSPRAVEAACVVVNRTTCLALIVQSEIQPYATILTQRVSREPLRYPFHISYFPLSLSPGSPVNSAVTRITGGDTTSTEGLSTIAALLNSPSKITDARNLRGDRAQRCIDIIDQLLTLRLLDERLFRRFSQLLYKICKTRGMLPASYVIRPEFVHAGKPQWSGGFGDVSKGEYQGRPVAVKHLRIRTGKLDTIYKQLCREVLIWKRLSHPNILSLLGVSISENPSNFRIISEWMDNGNVTEYIKSNPGVNRLRLLSEAASGVTYLHDLGIAHGDLKGANILIDHTGKARLGDFGLVVMADLSAILLSNTADPSRGTIHWMSPELLYPAGFHSDGLPSRQSDCYALGMVIYEVLSGFLPFYHLQNLAVLFAIVGGERPVKPLNASSLGFTDTLWGFLQLCWSESVSARPTAQQLLEYLQPASLTWVPPSTPYHTAGSQAVGGPSSGEPGTSETSSPDTLCRALQRLAVVQ